MLVWQQGDSMGCYRNAMEMLVEREVEEQMKRLPPKVAAYINRLELVAFALNHLPALYATSERGLEHQLQRGQAKYAAQITQAVQRALVAVRRDPIRSYAPLQPPSPPLMQDVLRQVRMLLNNDSVSWDSLPITIERALTAAKRDGRMAATGNFSPSSPPVAVEPATQGQSPLLRQYPVASHRPAPAPAPPRAANRQASQTSWPTRSPQTGTPQPSSPETYGWDDPFHR